MFFRLSLFIKINSIPLTNSDLIDAFTKLAFTNELIITDCGVEGWRANRLARATARQARATARQACGTAQQACGAARQARGTARQTCATARRTCETADENVLEKFPPSRLKVLRFVINID